MSEPLYIARATVAKIAGTRRRLTLATGEAFNVGVHGPIKDLYGHFRALPWSIRRRSSSSQREGKPHFSIPIGFRPTTLEQQPVRL